MGAFYQVYCTNSRGNDEGESEKNLNSSDDMSFKRLTKMPPRLRSCISNGDQTVNNNTQKRNRRPLSGCLDHFSLSATPLFFILISVCPLKCELVVPFCPSLFQITLLSLVSAHLYLLPPTKTHERCPMWLTWIYTLCPPL